MTVKLIKDYGEAHVYARLERFATLIASGYQPRQSGALLVDIIKDQEGKYGDGAGIVSVQKVATKPRQGTEQTGSRNAPRHDSTDAEDAREEAEFRALPLEEQAARTVSALKMILRSSAGDGILTRLQSALVAGQLDGRDLLRQAGRAALEMNLQAFVEDLRQLVGRNS